MPHVAVVEAEEIEAPASSPQVHGPPFQRAAGEDGDVAGSGGARRSLSRWRSTIRSATAAIKPVVRKPSKQSAMSSSNDTVRTLYGLGTGIRMRFLALAAAISLNRRVGRSTPRPRDHTT